VDIRRGDPTRLGKCGLARLAGELTQRLVPSLPGGHDFLQRECLLLSQSGHGDNSG
jgi:hypothetical protein